MIRVKGPVTMAATIADQNIIPFISVACGEVRTEIQLCQGLLRFGNIFQAFNADKAPQGRCVFQQHVTIVGGRAANGHHQSGIRKLSIGQDLGQGCKQIFPLGGQENTQPIMILVVFAETVKGMPDRRSLTPASRAFIRAVFIRIDLFRP